MRARKICGTACGPPSRGGCGSTSSIGLAASRSGGCYERSVALSARELVCSRCLEPLFRGRICQRGTWRARMGNDWTHTDGPMAGLSAGEAVPLDRQWRDTQRALCSWLACCFARLAAAFSSRLGVETRCSGEWRPTTHTSLPTGIGLIHSPQLPGRTRRSPRAEKEDGRGRLRRWHHRRGADWSRPECIRWWCF